jgi:hypothetical protein
MYCRLSVYSWREQIPAGVSGHAQRKSCAGLTIYGTPLTLDESFWKATDESYYCPFLPLNV